MENKKQKIVEMYKSGSTVKDICTICKCSTNTITKVLAEFNIPQRQIKNYKKDLSKFFDLTKQETQYWIGYICADGNIQYSKERRNYKVSLFSKEEEPIQKFKEYFGDIISIHRRPTGIIEAYISSKALCEYFINTLNITPAKSQTINPNIDFTNHFIRGYFDGDGSIRNDSPNQKRYECNITCGNKEFLDKIQKILNEYNIYSTMYKHTDCEAYKIRIDRKEDSKKFYNFLYKDCKIYLSRKYNRFVALYGDIE